MKFKNFRIPNWTNATEMTTYKGRLFLQYMKERALANQVGAGQTVVAYTHGATIVGGGYVGGVLNADGSRIYLTPRNMSAQTVWHYIDTATATVVPYTHGGTGLVASAYWGGCLAPNGRIYLAPYGQSTATVWHYIDTNTNTVVAYSHGVTAVANAYMGIYVQPSSGRIYFCPQAQCTATVWHYIDTDGTVVAYTHGATLAGSYRGGTIATDGRIYLAPYTSSQTTSATWHYIDTDGTVKAYTHGSAVTGSYYALCVAGNGNIYSAPPGMYINPNTLTVGTTSGAASRPTSGGVTIGANGRIYVCCNNSDTWQYIDTSSNTIVDYTTPIPVGTNYVIGSILAPNGRIYLMPYNLTTSPWYYIDTSPDNDFSENVCTSPYLNKF